MMPPAMTIGMNCVRVAVVSATMRKTDGASGVAWAGCVEPSVANGEPT